MWMQMKIAFMYHERVVVCKRDLKKAGDYKELAHLMQINLPDFDPTRRESNNADQSRLHGRFIAPPNHGFNSRVKIHRIV